MLFPVIFFLLLGIMMKFCISSRMNLFLFFHRVIFIVICLGAYFHGAYWVLYLGLTGVLFEIFLRVIFMIKNRMTLMYPYLEILGEDYVKITYQKKSNFRFKPGQYCYFYAPWLSVYNLHPFSINNSNVEKEVSFIIKKAGNWTSHLFKYAKNKQDITLFVDGPYGGSKIDFNDENYDYFLFLAGGVGITPLLSFQKSL